VAASVGLAVAGLSAIGRGTHEIHTASSVAAVPATEPPSTLTSTVAPTTSAPVGATQSFVLRDSSIPVGFELMAASNGLSFTERPAPSFTGVLVSVGADGRLARPIISMGTNPHAPNTADNVNKTPGFISVDVPTKANIAIGDVQASYMERPWAPAPDGSATAQLQWTVGGHDAWMDGPADRDLLGNIARRAAIDADGALALDPPPNMRWFAGPQYWGEHRSYVTYRGPNLTSIQVTTADAPSEGLEAFIVRTEQDITPLEIIDGRPTQVKRQPNGTRRLQFVEAGRLVVIAQSSPWADTDPTKPLPLNDTTLLSIARELRLAPSAEWSSLVTRLEPASPEEGFVGKILAGPRVLPLTGPHGATTNPTIALQPSTREGEPFTIAILIPTDEGAYGGGGGPIKSVEGLYIESASRGGSDETHAMTTKTVQAGPRVADLTVIQADGSQQPVALVEPFADLLPGQRWGLVEYVADGARLKATYSDGQSELLPIF
jgi:hypothetical protein